MSSVYKHRQLPSWKPRGQHGAVLKAFYRYSCAWIIQKKTHPPLYFFSTHAKRSERVAFYSSAPSSSPISVSRIHSQHSNSLPTLTAQTLTSFSPIAKSCSSLSSPSLQSSPPSFAPQSYSLTSPQPLDDLLNSLNASIQRCEWKKFALDFSIQWRHFPHDTGLLDVYLSARNRSEHHASVHSKDLFESIEHDVFLSHFTPAQQSRAIAALLTLPQHHAFPPLEVVGKRSTPSSFLLKMASAIDKQQWDDAIWLSWLQLSSCERDVDAKVNLLQQHRLLDTRLRTANPNILNSLVKCYGVLSCTSKASHFFSQLQALAEVDAKGSDIFSAYLQAAAVMFPLYARSGKMEKSRALFRQLQLHPLYSQTPFETHFSLYVSTISALTLHISSLFGNRTWTDDGRARLTPNERELIEATHIQAHDTFRTALLEARKTGMMHSALRPLFNALLHFNVQKCRVDGSTPSVDLTLNTMMSLGVGVDASTFTCLFQFILYTRWYPRLTLFFDSEQCRRDEETASDSERHPTIHRATAIGGDANGGGITALKISSHLSRIEGCKVLMGQMNFMAIRLNDSHLASIYRAFLLPRVHPHRHPVMDPKIWDFTDKIPDTPLSVLSFFQVVCGGGTAAEVKTVWKAQSIMFRRESASDSPSASAHSFSSTSNSIRKSKSPPPADIWQKIVRTNRPTTAHPVFSTVPISTKAFDALFMAGVRLGSKLSHWAVNEWWKIVGFSGMGYSAAQTQPNNFKDASKPPLYLESTQQFWKSLLDSFTPVTYTRLLACCDRSLDAKSGVAIYLHVRTCGLLSASVLAKAARLLKHFPAADFHIAASSPLNYLPPSSSPPSSPPDSASVPFQSDFSGATSPLEDVGSFLPESKSYRIGPLKMLPSQSSFLSFLLEDCKSLPKRELAVVFESISFLSGESVHFNRHNMNSIFSLYTTMSGSEPTHLMIKNIGKC